MTQPALVDRNRPNMGALHFSGMHRAYPVLRDLIVERGERVAPRGEATIELRGASFLIQNAVMRGVPVGCGRKVGVKMQAIDGAGNLAGRSYPDVAIRVAPVLERFSDVLDVHALNVTHDVAAASGARHGDPFFQGAYGPRIGDQLERVERQLRRDPATRQAVVSLWREEDRDPAWLDRPCTTEFQLMLRDDGLHVFVFMRANDLWTGTCYDVFQFGQVQAAMAHVLGVPWGPYHHYATSLHIYERDLEKFEAVRPWHSDPVAPFLENPREQWGPPWDEFEGDRFEDWAEVRSRFNDLWSAARYGRSHYRPPSNVEQWYWSVLGGAR